MISPGNQGDFVWKMAGTTYPHADTAVAVAESFLVLRDVQCLQRL